MERIFSIKGRASIPLFSGLKPMEPGCLSSQLDKGSPVSATDAGPLG